MGTKDQDNFGIALTKCYFCGEDDVIIMNKRLTPKMAETVREMHGKVVSMTPCQKCEEYMKQGVILITIDTQLSEKDWNNGKGDNGMPNPYRTGGFFVLTDEAISRIFDQEMAKWAIDTRFAFIEHEAAEKIGLFKFASTEVQQ